LDLDRNKSQSSKRWIVDDFDNISAKHRSKNSDREVLKGKESMSQFKDQDDPIPVNIQPETIVDIDNDGLDDRLYKGPIVNNSVQDVLNRIDQLHIENLPEDLLFGMLDNMDKEQQRLIQVARTKERIVHAELLKGNYQIVSKTRKAIRTLKREQNSLIDLQHTLHNQIQEQRLHFNMSKRIGEKYVRVMQWTSMLLTFLVLVLMFIDLNGPREDWLNPWNIFYVDSLCCVFFLSEFVFGYTCANDKHWFMKNHWIDLVTAIPIPPAAEGSRFIRFGRTFRFARLLRVLRLLKVVRLLRTFVFLSKTLRYMQDLMDLKTMQRSLTLVCLVIIAGGVTITLVEPDPTATGIETLGHGMWWSFSTVVTGGFADLYNPMSLAGQILTGLLVLSGMILVGVFTATLTTLYMGDDNSEMEKSQQRLLQQIADLQRAVDNLKQSQESDKRRSVVEEIGKDEK